MSSITLCITSTYPSSAVTTSTHDGIILHKNNNYIVVSLHKPIEVILPTASSLHKYKTRYIRLNRNGGDISVYVLHDRSTNSINILEHLLRTSPDITRTYVPYSQHTWDICT